MVGMTHEDLNNNADPWVDADHSGEADDAWHQHAGEDAPQHAHGETTPGAIALFGVISFTALLVTVVLVGFYFFQVNKWKRVERIEVFLGEETRQMMEGWESTLTTYGWADVADGEAVHIPLDQATDLFIQERASR